MRIQTRRVLVKLHEQLQDVSGDGVSVFFVTIKVNLKKVGISV